MAEHLADYDLQDGAEIEILEGEFKGTRGKLVGWVTSKGVKHKHNGGHVSTVAVQVGPKDENSKEGYQFFGFKKVQSIDKLNMVACLALRSGTLLGDARIPGAGDSLQDSFMNGDCGAIVEALMKLKDDASAWVEAKAVGDANAKEENTGTAISHTTADPTFIRCITPVEARQNAVKRAFQDGMGSAAQWDNAIQEIRVVKELTVSAKESEMGITRMRITHVKLNNTGMLGAISGARDTTLLEMHFSFRGRDIDGFAYAYVDRNPDCPSAEGSRVDAGYALLSAEPGKVAYVGKSLGTTGWSASPNAVEAVKDYVLPTAQVQKFSQGSVGACGLGFCGL